MIKKAWKAVKGSRGNIVMTDQSKLFKESDMMGEVYNSSLLYKILPTYAAHYFFQQKNVSKND